MEGFLFDLFIKTYPKIVFNTLSHYQPWLTMPFCNVNAINVGDGRLFFFVVD